MICNEGIALARENIARRNALKEKLQVLYGTQKQLRQQSMQLEEARLREEKDVKRLEGFSLDALLSFLSGTKAEKLEKERSEAETAALSHEEALRRLEKLELEIRITEEEFASLRGCDREYRLLLAKKLDAVKQSASPAAETLAALENKLSEAETSGDRLREAFHAGGKALGAAYSALEMYGEVIEGIHPVKNITRIMDTIDESRLIADAQSTIASMQDAVRRFGALLKELNIPVPVFAPDGDVPYSPAVPYLFSRISAGFSMDEIEKMQAQIRSALDILGSMLNENAAECARIRAQLDSEILAAESDD